MNNKIDKFMQNKGLSPKYRGYYTLRQIILNWEIENNKSKLLLNIANQNGSTVRKMTKNIKLALKNSSLENYCEIPTIEFLRIFYSEFLHYMSLGSEYYDN